MHPSRVSPETTPFVAEFTHAGCPHPGAAFQFGDCGRAIAGLVKSRVVNPAPHLEPIRMPTVQAQQIVELRSRRARHDHRPGDPDGVHGGHPATHVRLGLGVGVRMHVNDRIPRLLHVSLGQVENGPGAVIPEEQLVRAHRIAGLRGCATVAMAGDQDGEHTRHQEESGAGGAALRLQPPIRGTAAKCPWRPVPGDFRCSTKTDAGSA